MLQPETVLNNRYVVIEVYTSFETEIFYVAWDKVSDKKVIISEFFVKPIGYSILSYKI